MKTNVLYIYLLTATGNGAEADTNKRQPFQALLIGYITHMGYPDETDTHTFVLISVSVYTNEMNCLHS